MAEILSANMSGLIPVELSNQIIADITRGSAAMAMCKPVPMTAPTKKFPVMLSKPGAYWVGETERIQTSQAQWSMIEMSAKKLGVIVPVSKEALNDSTIDVFSTLKPYIAEAFAKAFDEAVIFGTASPYGKDKSILEMATAAGNVVTEGVISGQAIDGDVSDAMALIEAENFDVNGFMTHIGVKNQLRKFKDNDGNLIFQDVHGDTPAQLLGTTLSYVRNGAFDSTKAKIIAGNFDMAYYGILQGIEYEVLREATLETVTGTDGKPLNLAEQDMLALKATMRIAFLVIKDKAFSILKPKAQA